MFVKILVETLNRENLLECACCDVIIMRLILSWIKKLFPSFADVQLSRIIDVCTVDVKRKLESFSMAKKRQRRKFKWINSLLKDFYLLNVFNFFKILQFLPTMIALMILVFTNTKIISRTSSTHFDIFRIEVSPSSRRIRRDEMFKWRQIKVNWWADNLFIENIIICARSVSICVCLCSVVLMRTVNIFFDPSTNSQITKLIL